MEKCQWIKMTQWMILIVAFIAKNSVCQTNNTRLRHLDVRSQFLSQIESVAQSDDNHPPVFPNCSKYAPEMNEEQPPGTVVIQVRAEDPDLPENGGTITYKLERAFNEHLKFEIDNKTGLIVTTQFLDRDWPFHEQQVYLSVRAVDNGRPQRLATCTFKVMINDINDNEPVFDQVTYTKLVPQDLPPTHEILKVSASDFDDGNNGVGVFSLFSKSPDDDGYFYIDNITGVIFLKKPIDRHLNYTFSMTLKVQDLGDEPKSTTTDLDIRVVDADKKAPIFLPRSQEAIKILENFSDAGAIIVRLEAVSNIEDNRDLMFELVTGYTEETNAANTFRLESRENIAEIKLAQPLDYERNTEYTLTVRVQNKYRLTTETWINIEVLDVNDNIPIFHEMKNGSVFENEAAGMPVMQVRAFDADGTSAHNQVTYELDNFKNIFAIDKYTGEITTLKTLDREVQDVYSLKVMAIDNSPSALTKTGKHNKGEQGFSIEIADENDNPPHFTQAVYTANSIPENSNLNKLVTKVKALDADTGSTVTYRIIAGNEDDRFYILDEIGEILINKHLDYEQQTEYNLTVEASDGLRYDKAQVQIFVQNVNDIHPIFEDLKKNPKIVEEQLIEGCITTLVAYDPDIKDRAADQHIFYFIPQDYQRRHIGIDETGCMTLKKPLDRDPPNGSSLWEIMVIARDDDGASTALSTPITVKIALEDINDNAPFLDMKQPVIWDENKPPGNITKLKAHDYDTEKNGAPFKYQIDDNADNEINEKFNINIDVLYAREQFDREERKNYEIPIVITDSGTPKMTGTSTLTVIIGDKNDNSMMEGSSSIFVYNYRGEAPDLKIGRVYVNDPDDWDLPDKSFAWMSELDEFRLDSSTGMITLVSGTFNGTFLLKFFVTEYLPGGKMHTVNAFVHVTIKEISEEAIMKSGSIRFHGISAEDFVKTEILGKSKREILKERLAEIFHTSIDNVDVFTVLHSPHHNNAMLLDVRFSVYENSYDAAEKLNTITALNSKEIERDMKTEILLINIDECLFEKLHCNNSCQSVLNVSNVGYTIYTNISSFVGVRAVVDPQCNCHVAMSIVCLNGGTPLGEHCECLPNFDGPKCELLEFGFHGDGLAVMSPPGQSCNDSYLGFELTSQVDSGLVFYLGPISFNPKFGIQDFMSLEIQNGYPVLFVDYGTGTVRLDHKQIKLTDGKSHRIDVHWTKTAIEMKVDNCNKSACIISAAPRGKNEFLNINSPLQIGGTLTNMTELSTNLGWNYKPTNKGFVGCIRNMTINGNTYNLATAKFTKNAYGTCDNIVVNGVFFPVGTNFIVAILVCIAILLILILGFVIRTKTSYDFPSKIESAECQNKAPHEVADTCICVTSIKETYDKDDNWNPCDANVRHYAYEGEENFYGSLSSIASCTDDEDLEFGYLDNFGPMFRTLADMYNEESRDEDSEQDS